MKQKDIILTLILFLLFVVLIFTTPFVEAGISSLIWIAFFGCISLILIIWIIISALKTSKENSMKNFKNQPLMLQILEIIFIISIVYEAMTFQNFKISGLILFIILIIWFIDWFLKKEED